MNATSCPLMPEWHIAHWFNTDGPLRVADLRGQVVLIPLSRCCARAA